MTVTFHLNERVKVHTRKTVQPTVPVQPTVLSRKLDFGSDEQIPKAKAACEVPKLNPFDKTAMKYIVDIDKLVCKGVDHAQLKDGVLKVKASNVRDALIRYIRRKENDDFNLDFSEPIKLINDGIKSVSIKKGE